MNIEKIKEDMIIKNYKELCNLLGERIKTGYSKIKQLKELSAYCNYSKQGNKFIINKIHKVPTISLNDLMKTKNSKYIKLLSNIIIEYLYNNPKKLKQIPLLRLISILGITNNNYTDSSYYKKELSQLFDIQLVSIYYFYSNTKREYKRIIERCLNNLQNRRVLNWSRCIIIIDKKNKCTYKANDEIQKEIINTEKQALQYLNVNNMYELMKDRNKLKEFNSILKKEMGFEYYYAYDLVIGDIALKIEYENVQLEKVKLNKLIIERTNKIFDKPFFEKFKNDYIALINLLINLDNNNPNLKQLLKDKHSDNMMNYINNKLIVDKKYDDKINELQKTYLDKYDI